jgi:hypothetical protein
MVREEDTLPPRMLKEAITDGSAIASATPARPWRAIW